MKKIIATALALLLSTAVVAADQTQSPSPSSPASSTLYLVNMSALQKLTPQQKLTLQEVGFFSDALGGVGQGTVRLANCAIGISKCTYDGKDSSPGAVIKQVDGNKKCKYPPGFAAPCGWEDAAQ